jgi:hypothetical protein
MAWKQYKEELVHVLLSFGCCGDGDGDGGDVVAVVLCDGCCGGRDGPIVVR